jgi:hypothetical protein
MMGKVSEHGKGNAVDIKGLTFADNRSLHLTDMTAPKDLRVALRESTCARFTTVLGPGSDGYHEEHIHLDLAERRNGFRICQWDVREPPPPPPPPKKEEKKDEAQAQAQAEPQEQSQEQAEAAPDQEEADEQPAAAPITGPIPLPRPKPGFLKRLKHRFF